MNAVYLSDLIANVFFNIIAIAQYYYQHSLKIDCNYFSLAVKIISFIILLIIFECKLIHPDY